MTKLYRYFDEDFGTQLIRDGKIRLGTFNKYRRKEIEENDKVRGDRDDGVKTVVTDEYVSGTPLPKIMEGLIHVEGNVIVRNLRVNFESGNVLVLCMSKKICPNLAKDFDNATECIQINNPDLFFHQITKSLNKAFPGKFKFEGYFPCEYVTSREFMCHESDAHIKNQRILKTDNYKYQEEVRALWLCVTGGLEYEHIDLVCPKIHKFCSLIDFRVHRDGGSGYSYKVFM